MRNAKTGIAILLGALALFVPAPAFATYGTPPPKPGCPGLEAGPEAAKVRQLVRISANGVANGTVIFFKDGALALGQATVTGGAATFETAALGAGTHVFTATLANGANASGAIHFAIAQAATTLSVKQLTTTSHEADIASFIATVASDPGPVADGGEVEFLDRGVRVGAAVPIKEGIAKLDLTSLALGEHAISAIYKGTADFTASTSTSVLHTVDAKPVVAPPEEPPVAPDPASDPKPSGIAGTPEATDDDASCSSSGKSAGTTGWLVALALVAATRTRRRRR